MYNFIDSCLNRSAAPDDAESYVEYWHTHDLNCSLREYMGMSASDSANAIKIPRFMKSPPC